METYEFTIDAASTDIGTRLDKYLTEQIPDQSRSYIQKLLDDNFITLSNRRIFHSISSMRMMISLSSTNRRAWLYIRHRDIQAEHSSMP